MKKFVIYLVSKNPQFRNFFSDLMRKTILLEKMVVIEREGDIFEAVLKLKNVNGFYIYDSDFSSNMSSTSFIQKVFSIFPESKIIIMGNDAIEAKRLINNQVCPFGYINKKDNWEKIEKTLLFLIFKEQEKKAERIKEIGSVVYGYNNG